MNTNSHDEQLGRLLQECSRVKAQRNPAFRPAVWSRIDASRRAPLTWKAWLRLHLVQFSSLAVAVLVLAGTGGAWIAKAQSNRHREQLVERYLVSIDPHLQLNSEQR